MSRSLQPFLREYAVRGMLLCGYRLSISAWEGESLMDSVEEEAGEQEA